MEGLLDFSRLLSPAQRKRLTATRREMERLYRLPDRWLAEEVLRLARRMRLEHPDKLSEPDGVTYDSNFVWVIVPEIARRLGCRNLAMNEASDWFVRSLDAGEFRQYVGHYLKNCSINRWIDVNAENPSAAELLMHEVANGNPVAMALDRICLAPERGNDRNDYVARQLREVSKRRGFAETAEWSPGLQHWGKERVR